MREIGVTVPYSLHSRGVRCAYSHNRHDAHEPAIPVVRDFCLFVASLLRSQLYWAAGTNLIGVEFLPTAVFWRWNHGVEFVCSFGGLGFQVLGRESMEEGKAWGEQESREASMGTPTQLFGTAYAFESDLAVFDKRLGDNHSFGGRSLGRRSLGTPRVLCLSGIFAMTGGSVTEIGFVLTEN